MRRLSKTYISVVYGGWSILVSAGFARAQGITATGENQTSCAAVLANDSSIGSHIGPTDSANGARDTSARARADTTAFGVGGARSGPADVMLLVGVHVDSIRFAAQPHVRVRLCWGGDTVRVVQRDNLPSPIVPGTTYKNVYIAVEILGRVNAECLAETIGVGNNSAPGARRANGAARAAAGTPSASSCAFIGGTADTRAQNTRPPPR
jgi:hypothetical protein